MCLFDEKALELKAKLPEGLLEHDAQTQYTYLASGGDKAAVASGSVLRSRAILKDASAAWAL